ncbi:MAG: HAD family phosphatase [Candidatus Latescibacterota bacterium]|nr:HAD family phosphatase [Candidatus Latescibacterota bacterium]
MGLQAMLWDNDGVLVDTEPLYFEASARILSEVGVELTKRIFVQTSLTAGSSLLDLAPGGQQKRETLRDRRNALYADLIAGQDLTIDGAKETLEILTNRVRMMVVTSSRHDHFKIIHRSTELLSYFEGVIDREDYANSKPDPEPYLTGLARLGVEADDCIVVEDSTRGMISAIQAGLRCVVVPNMLTKDGDFSGAYKVVDSVRDVVEVVEELL